MSDRQPEIGSTEHEMRVRTTKRRGRLPAEVRAGLAERGPHWSVAPPPWSAAVLDACFGRRARRLLDIGAGNGDATRSWAQANPDGDVVAVELHRPGLARLVRQLDGTGPPNVRLAELDARDAIVGAASGTFADVRILFPDPWPKRRHLARRLVDAEFIAAIAMLLPVGGTLHVASDWRPYIEQLRSAIDDDQRLAPLSDDPSGAWVSARPSRPVTVYEQRAHDAGRAVVDLVATRIADLSTDLHAPST